MGTKLSPAVKLRAALLGGALIVSQIIFPAMNSSHAYPLFNWDLFSGVAQRNSHFDVQLVFADGKSILFSSCAPCRSSLNFGGTWGQIQQAGLERRLQSDGDALRSLRGELEKLDLQKDKVRLMGINGFLMDHITSESDEKSMEDMGSIWPP